MTLTRFFTHLLLLFTCLNSVTTQAADRLMDYRPLIKEAELAGDFATVAERCREWYASGSYSSGALNWNYNALMSVEQGALLVTQTDDDTYPVWLLQYALGVRPDVRILNLAMLENDHYRDIIIATENLRFIPSGTAFAEFMQLFLSEKNTKPTYFGVSLDKTRLKDAQKDLYLTGLALKWSRIPFDNVAALRHNVEQAFRLDYLRLNLDPVADPAALAQLNLNYLPAFLLLYTHYKSAGELVKADQLRELALQIARAGGRGPEVTAFFNQSPPDRPVAAAIMPKKIEKGMKKVADRLWASETETSNAQYELFLQDLLKNRDFEQLNTCKTTKTDWRALLADGDKGIPDAVLFANGHPDQPDAPVQNISYEAAQRYCFWLTAAYNGSAEKKKFKKVVFRLPTAAEWTMAAKSNIKSAPYPWNGNAIQNAKGCYLLNLNATKSCGDCPDDKKSANDGGFFPVPVVTYYPNALGLYNVSGNVAEMLQEPGHCKGGSWQDDGDHCHLDVLSTYTVPGPQLGFRVFMEVIEE